MSIESMVEILRAFLNKEGYVLCKASDTQWGLDGLREVEALREIVSLIDDAREAEYWGKDARTPVIPLGVTEALKALSKVVAT